MSESSTPGPHVLATQGRCLAEAQSAVAENQGQRQYRNNPWYESVTHPLPRARSWQLPPLPTHPGRRYRKTCVGQGDSCADWCPVTPVPQRRLRYAAEVFGCGLGAQPNHRCRRHRSTSCRRSTRLCPNPFGSPRADRKILSIDRTVTISPMASNNRRTPRSRHQDPDVCRSRNGGHTRADSSQSYMSRRVQRRSRPPRRT